MKTYTFAQAQSEFKKHPYFLYPQISALASATPEERQVLLRRIAANIGNEATLRTAIGVDPEEFAQFYKDMLPDTPSTGDTISAFIERYSSAAEAETPEVEEIVTAPAIDYAAMMLEDEEEESADAPADTTAATIDSFLEAVPVKKPKRKPLPQASKESPKEAAPETYQETLREAPQETRQETRQETPKASEERPQLSEALFKLMVKNRNYDKALEIITELSLNNPKKSIYFADQIRFLKKLAQNQKRLDSSTK